MSTLYKKYRRYAPGGTLEAPSQFGGAAMAGAGAATGLIDAFDTPNEYGHQSGFGTVAKSTLSMAATGASVGGPIGAAIGGGLGLVTGFIKSSSNSAAERQAKSREMELRNTMDRNNSAVRIAGNPTLVEGYRNAQMFATGGTISPAPVAPLGDSNNDTLPSYLNYIKAVQTKNDPGTTMALNHIRDVRGPQMATQMQFMGKSLGNTNINDIAKRNAGMETNPQMRLLYNTINENPDIVNKFQYEMLQPDLVKHAAGGPIQTPKDTSQEQRYKAMYGPVEDRLNKLVAKIGYNNLPASTQNFLNSSIGRFSKEGRNIPPMDDTIKEVQQKLSSLSDQEAEKFLKKDWSHATLWDAFTARPKGVGLGEMVKYSSHFKDLKSKGYTLENGGPIKAPLSAAYTSGGTIKPTSSGTTEIEGNSHAEGGVKVPQINAEMEDGETTSGNFVFSKELGFAKLHKPIARMKGIIEKKPQTAERVAAINLLNGQENKLALSQEYTKQRLGIQ